MTSDEVKAVIREAIFNSITITYDRATDTDQISCDPEKSAEAVLAALRDAGLVIGELVGYTSLSPDDANLALVRVVTTDE